MGKTAANGRVKGAFQLTLVALIALAGMAGCTKKKELKNTVSTNAYMNKADLENKIFHLVRGIEEANSENKVEATPGRSEDFGLVQARVTERELQLVSVYHPRGRPETMEIIASYPITDHFDIKRETNDYKEETHRIVEDRERPWNERQYMRVAWDNPSNSSSSFTSQLTYGGALSLPLSEENVVLREAPKVENGHISWLVETNVKNRDENFTYVADGDYEMDRGARVVYRTHLMPVKDSDFRPVEYSWKDFGRFGYFYTQQNFEDPERGFLDSDAGLKGHLKTVKKYANVFNVCEKGQAGSCATNKITWVLTKGFPDKYLPEAREAVKEWNETFKKSLKRDDDVVVLDENTKVDISDPRHNVIAYYEPKSAGGLLGVAQWVADPRTGEIVAARATIYEDGIRYTLGSVDSLIDILADDDPMKNLVLADALNTDVETASPYTADAKILAASNRGRMTALTPSVIESTGFRAPFTGVAESSKIRKTALAARSKDVLALPQIGLPIVKSSASKNMTPSLPNLNGAEDLLFVAEKMRAQKLQFMRRAEIGIHGAELVDDATMRYILSLAKTKSAKQLLAEKADIKEKVAKMTFYSTLLHEMGHTFGLRHNFAASSDKAHYVKKYNDLANQMKTDANVTSGDLEPYAYSSIMDYGADFYSQAGGLGPYDKAAIKYAYNRGINRDADEVTLANYKFCTDHQVDETILCRRFDKGSNISEVTQNIINRYNTRWILSHNRRGRADFDTFERRVPGSILTGTMIPVRQVMDEFMYTLIMDPKVKATKGNICDYTIVADSLKRKEIGDICNDASARASGVNLSNLATFENALYKPESLKKVGKAAMTEEDLRVKVSDMKAYALADLLWANKIAKDFFFEVLSTMEPGTYLALPQQGRQERRLYRLKYSKNVEGLSDDERLKVFAGSIGVEDADAFAQTYKQFLVEIPISRYARPFSSASVVEGGNERLVRIGSFWDKLTAIIALSTRDLNVQKYSQISMAGSAYSWEHTSAFTQQMFTNFIAGDRKMRLVMVRPKYANQSVVAEADATQDISLRSYATFSVFSDFYTDSDPSVLEKIRICNANEQNCLNELGGEVAEFRSQKGGDKFRAVQSPEGDSIAFQIVAGAMAVDQDRARVQAILVESKQPLAAEKIATLADIDVNSVIHQRVHENLGKVQKLAHLREILTEPATDESKDPSAFELLGVIVSVAPRVAALDILEALEAVGGNMAAALEESKAVAAELGPDSDEGKAAAAIVADLTQVLVKMQPLVEPVEAMRRAPSDIDDLSNEIGNSESVVRMIRRYLKALETGVL